MDLFADFLTVFGVWEVAQPYIHLVVTEDEIRLVVTLKNDALTQEEIGERLGSLPDQTSELLKQAYARCVVNKQSENNVTRYVSAGFSERLDQFAKYENWHDIPPAERAAIDRRFLDEFINQHQENVLRKLHGKDSENSLPNDAVMLLEEVEAMVNAADCIVVQPCDCRRLGENCERPVETCIWLDEGAHQALDRGQGRQINQEQALELLRWADRKGLMHTADSDWAANGLHTICNCCACDCYPFRAAQELDSKGVWPKSRYIAVHDPQTCNLCGACVRRCHFEAFSFEDSMREVDGKLKQNVVYDPEKCWGCGLCANTCVSEAIVMEPLGN